MLAAMQRPSLPKVRGLGVCGAGDRVHTHFSQGGCAMWNKWNKAGQQSLCEATAEHTCGRHRGEMRAVCLCEELASEILSHRNRFFACP